MDAAGVYSLASLPLTVARPLSLLSPITGLGGMSSASLEVNFQWGSGGATCSVIVATTFDNWTTARHIARFDFTTATAVKVANIQASAVKAVAAYVDLSAEGVNDGILGDQIAAYIISTGTYSNTTLSVRASVR